MPESSAEIVLTEQQVNKAKSEAKFRKDNFEKHKSNPVKFTYKVDKAGLLTILFNRPVFFPSYMIDFINSPNDAPTPT